MLKAGENVLGVEDIMYEGSEKFSLNANLNPTMLTYYLNLGKPTKIMLRSERISVIKLMNLINHSNRMLKTSLLSSALFLTSAAHQTTSPS